MGLLKKFGFDNKLEEYSFISLLASSLLVSAGIGLSILTPKGFPVLLIITGSLGVLASIIALIASWLR